jgi:hypothetical protein
MSNPVVSPAPIGWLFGPPASLLTYVLDERRLANIMERSLHLIGQMDWLLTIAKEKIKPGDEKYIETFDGLIEIARSDAGFANQEYNAGCPNVYAHHVVALWGAIESTVEQIAINHILVVPAAAKLIAKVAPSLAGKIAVDSEDDAREAYRCWEFKTIAKDAVGKAMEMLRVFQFLVTLADEKRRDLNELSELRNVLVHRNSVIDARFLNKCDWTEWKLGDTVQLNEIRTRRYFDAAGDFAMALVNGVVNSPYRMLKASV